MIFSQRESINNHLILREKKVYFQIIKYGALSRKTIVVEDSLG